MMHDQTKLKKKIDMSHTTSIYIMKFGNNHLKQKF